MPNTADRNQGLADFLPWAALVAKGVVLNKDGSFQRTARFRGPDLDSATPAELVAITARLNNALRRLGSGWAIFIEAQRVPAQTLPRTANFPMPRLGTGRCRAPAEFEEEGAHFESGLLPDASSGCRRPTMPPAPKPGSTRAAPGQRRRLRTRTLDGFVDRTDRVLAAPRRLHAGSATGSMTARR